MVRTGREFMEYWDRMVDDGRMNPHTAAATRAAVTQVLGCLENPETVDVATLRVKDLLRRFESARRQDYRADTLRTYKTRFTRALEMFLTGDEPRTRRGRPRKSSSNPRPATTDSSTRQEVSNGDGAREYVEYPYPLEGGRTALLRLPRALGMEDVRRLSAFMATLTQDFTPGSLWGGPQRAEKE